jgi:hypothetical protein
MKRRFRLSTFRLCTFRRLTDRPLTLRCAQGRLYRLTASPRKSGRGAAPIPGPRPRPRQVPPPPATMVRPRAGGGSSAVSGPVEGPVLAGITVTVFPGRSSRSLFGEAPSSGVGEVLTGWATGWGGTGRGGGVHRSASFTLGSRGRERGARARRADRGGCCISTGEAIST